MEDHDREIVCNIPPSAWNSDQDSGVLTQNGDKFSSGWLTDGFGVYYEGSIDLSGYAMDDLTFFPFGSFMQEGGPFYYLEGAGAFCMDFVSSVPISLSEARQSMLAGSPPGFLQFYNPIPVYAEVERDQVIHGSFRLLANNSNFPGGYFITPEVTNSFSSLEPTAADKLYFMRLVYPFQNVENTPGDPGAIPPIPAIPKYGSNLLIPAARIVIAGKMSREPQLEYMMRLKRSYELANQGKDF